MNETLKNEYQFAIDNFGLTLAPPPLDNILMKMFNLLYAEKGSFRNDKDMGIGINSYIFELITPDLATKLQSIITNQFHKYLPDLPIRSVSVIPGKDKEIKVFSIVIELNRSINGVYLIKLENNSEFKSKLRFNVYTN